MANHSKTDQRHLALRFLDLTREEYAKAKRNRLYYAELGRQYGLTYSEIGESLGITPEAVRKMISRAAQ